MEKAIKLLSFLLVIGIVLCLSSCDSPPHRKLSFDDGESHCFRGGCSVSDDYVKINSSGAIVNANYEYYSISGRSFTITNCDCEDIKDN